MDFNMQALTWDSEKRIKRAKVIAEQITQAVPLKRHYRALEFGCGTGLISFNLFDKLKDITCIDTSKGMIDVLNAKIELFQVNNMVAYQYDINNESLLVPKYDFIFMSMALHHIADIETMLEKLYCLLKKDGHLCIVELDEDDGSFHKAEKDFIGHHGFCQEELKKVLDKIGLEELESHTFLNDQKMIDEVGVNYSLFIMKGKKLR
ncbi:MAG: hypothetical protein K0R78_1999 [Pelosinus sp.]|jgi:ubiquinone/menaquinone biosynthesis C-methylase UbiE|nr:hypothetical protein [Pelosinus sp.]